MSPSSPAHRPLSAPSFEPLASRLGAEPSATGEVAAHPLSFLQESLWLLHALTPPHLPVYNETLAWRFAGPLRADLVAQALAAIAERHSALRTVFVETPAGLRGVVRPQASLELEVVELGAGEGEAAAAEVIAARHALPFALAEEPPVRAVLVRAGEVSLLAVTGHHLVLDGWSFGILFSELRAHYRALSQGGALAELPPWPATYAELAGRQRLSLWRGELTAQLDYWKRALHGTPHLLALPLDRPRPAAQSHRGATYAIQIPRRALSPLFERARRQTGATEFQVLLAAYAALLHRESGQDQLAVGTALLGRSDAASLGVIGCFVNSVAIPFAVTATTTFESLLGELSRSWSDVLAHQDAPFPKVLEHLGAAHDPSHSPIFQTMMTSLGKRRPLELGGGVVGRPMRVARAAAKFELLVYVTELPGELPGEPGGEGRGDGDGVFELEVEYQTEVLSEATVARLVSHYVHLLGELDADFAAPLSSVSILPAAERRVLLEQWRGARVELRKTTVIDEIEAQARRSPSALAVEADDGALTYAELHRRTNRIAHALLAERVAGRDFVGVYMERSLDMVLALVSIMKAGLAYVPIDPEYPADRVRYMIEDSQVSLVLTQARHRDALGDGVRAVTLAELTAGRARRQDDDSDVVRALSFDSRAYMIYTSGSTGRPKGVINRHGSLYNRLWWMQSEYQIGEGDRVLQKTPFSFDVSVWEFFWPLMAGARIVVAKPGGHRDADYLKRLILDKQITTLHFVPSMLNVFLEEDELAIYCASLRQVFCSGEALSYRAVEEAARRMPAARLHNLYGPTEAAIDVSYWPCSLDYPGKIVPIGKAIANTSLYIVDKHLQLQPIGVAGELCIGGVGLAERYHNREDLTQKAFVPDRFSEEPGARMYRTGDLARYLPDGQIEYLGRIDNQIKLRGFRIELGEIEAVVQALPGVRKAAVIVHETRQSRMLVGYVVAEAFDAAAARAEMARQLPEFMIPQVLLAVADIPTTANGKLDRKALPDPLTDLTEAANGAGLGAARVAPATALEAKILEIWQEALGARGMGVEDNFFRAGGDSIRSIRVAARLRELGHAVAVQDVFAHPTVRQLARRLEKERAGSASSAAPAPAATRPFQLLADDVVAELAVFSAHQTPIEDAWPPSRLQLGMIYHSLMSASSSVYHDIFSYHLRAPTQERELRRALQLVVGRHPQLRSCFELERFGEPLQLITGEAQVPLQLDDLSGRSKEEQDAALRAWTDEEKRRPFDLQRPPLLRLAVQVRSAQALVLTLSFHHVILDGWSVAVVMDELCKTYAALLEGRPMALEQERAAYSSYVALERQAIGDPAHAAFWQAALDGAPPLLLAEPAATGAATDAAPRQIAQEVPEALAQAVRRAAGLLGVPVKSAYLAVHLHALAELAERDDVIGGLVSNGRPEVAGGEQMVGMFLATLPVVMRGARVRSGSAAWPAQIVRVFQREQELVPYRRLPLAEILARRRGGELFDALFNYTSFHAYAAERGDRVGITSADYFEETNFPMVVHASADPFTERMGWVIHFDSARLGAEKMRRYLDLSLAAIGEIAASGELELRAAAAGLRAASDNQTLSAMGATAATAADAAEAAREAGPAPAASPASPARAPDATTPLQRMLRDVIAEILGVAELGLDDDVMARGLDSILAIRILGKLKRQGLAVFVQDLFEHRTVRQLAAHLAQLATTATASQGSQGVMPSRAPRAIAAQTPPFAGVAPEVRARLGDGVKDAYPATPLQLQMIEAHRRDLAAAVYHDLFAYRIALPLDEDRLRQAVVALVQAHPALRTHFRLELTPPLQCVQAAALAPLEIFERPSDAEYDAWFDAERASSFDLTRVPLRFFAHRHDADSFTLTISFHHAILDGWSLSLLLRELIARYRGATPATPATIDGNGSGDDRGPSGRDYAHLAAASERNETLASFWRDELRGAPSGELPFGPGEAAGPRWSEAKLVLSTAQSDELAALAKRAGVPLKHALLAAHVAVLARTAQRGEILTATFVNGRLEEEGGEELLGMFLGFAPFRQRVDGHTWRSLLAATFATERRLLPYRRYPLSRLRADRAAAAAPLCLDTIFNYTRFAAYAALATSPDGDELVAGGRWFEHTEFPLLVNAGHDLRQEQLVLTFDADGRRLAQRQLEQLAERYRRALTEMVAHPDERVRLDV